jgi:hypothetical protein
MARSEEAIKKRAVKRQRTEEEQRKGDRVEIKRQEEKEAAKRQRREMVRPWMVETAPTANSTEEFPQIERRPPPPRARYDNNRTRMDTNHPSDKSSRDPLQEGGAWKCPQCDNQNFASRNVCNSKTCDQQRPDHIVVPPRQNKPKPRHDEGTSKTLNWGKQADKKTLADNQGLRKQFLETGGKGMSEEDVERAKVLITRDERRKQKIEQRKAQTTDTDETDQHAGRVVVEPEPVGEEATSEKVTPEKPVNQRAINRENKALRKRFLKTGGEGMDDKDAQRARILIERDARKKQKRESIQAENADKTTPKK